uniref:C-type lectin domain-containing protein n=1 Tax=Acrobeloides nanus TaxID=290746 RepID=A0A914DWS1_9BILA
MTWNEARSYCSNEYGGYLKDNLNAIDSSYLKAKTGNTEYWIGLSDFETPGTFAWDRGLNKPMEPLNPGDYNLWSNGQQPEYNANKTCVTDIGGQTWYQDDCNKKKYFICERASQQLPVGRYAFSASNCQGEYYNVKVQISPDTR